MKKQKKTIALLLMLALILTFTAGCAAKTAALIEEARHNKETENNKLEIETEPSDASAEASPVATPVEAQSIVPFLDKDGAGNFNASPNEIIYSMNKYCETAFDNEEQLQYSSYRYTDKENGTLFCMSADSSTTHPTALVVAGSAAIEADVLKVKELAAFVFRMTNENATAEQAQKYLEAMGVNGDISALTKEPTVKYSEFMTYEAGICNGVFYMTVSSAPGKEIKVEYPTLFSFSEPEPTQEPEEDVTDDGSIATGEFGGVTVKITDVRGGVTKNGAAYIGIELDATNNNAVAIDLGSVCYVEVSQNDTQMETISFLPEDTVEAFLTPIQPGRTESIILYYKCVTNEYTGISLLMKRLLDDDFPQINIQF